MRDSGPERRVYRIGIRQMPHPFGPYSKGLIDDTYDIIELQGNYALARNQWGHLVKVSLGCPHLVQTEFGAMVARARYHKEYYDSRRRG